MVTSASRYGADHYSAAPNNAAAAAAAEAARFIAALLVAFEAIFEIDLFLCLVGRRLDWPFSGPAEAARFKAP